MSLENKIANWMSLGIKPYDETMRIQESLVAMRKKNEVPDTILAVQHPLTVSFGASREHNQFSNMFLDRVMQKYGQPTHENALRYLSDEGISFTYSDRGGGATVFSPGQYVFYPVVNHSEITGKSLDVASYKSKIYKVLFDSLSGLGVRGLVVSDQSQFKERNERRDVWLNRDGKTLKMGSKGIKFSGDVAHHGFALYIGADSVLNNNLVNQCGYTPDEVTLWTVEQELGRAVEPEEIHSVVRSAFVRNFGYSEIRNILSLDIEKRLRGVL